MTTRILVTAGILATFYLHVAHCFLLRTTSFTPRSVAFIEGLRCSLPPTTRKRPLRREDRTQVRSTTMLSLRPMSHGLRVAAPGSFVVDAGFGSRAEGRAREACRRLVVGGEGMNMFHFLPTDTHSIMDSIGRVLFWGLVGGLQIKYTKQMLREKEIGLEVDERAEWEAENEDFIDVDTYVCAVCDNSNEIECEKCAGKGFFVSQSAQPRKCGYCAGLGKLECPGCEERREDQRHGRNRRRPPLQLPSGKDDDFPFDFPPFNR